MGSALHRRKPPSARRRVSLPPNWERNRGGQARRRPLRAQNSASRRGSRHGQRVLKPAGERTTREQVTELQVFAQHIEEVVTPEALELRGVDAAIHVGGQGAALEAVAGKASPAGGQQGRAVARRAPGADAEVRVHFDLATFCSRSNGATWPCRKSVRRHNLRRRSAINGSASCGRLFSRSPRRSCRKVPTFCSIRLTPFLGRQRSSNGAGSPSTAGFDCQADDFTEALDQRNGSPAWSSNSRASRTYPDSTCMDLWRLTCWIFQTSAPARAAAVTNPARSECPA